MIVELLFQSIGVIGIAIFYLIIAKLSARMGEGLRLPFYYRWDYVACVIVLSTILLHAYMHYKEIPHDSLFDLLYILMLLISNVIVILVSKRYWWWLKDEIRL